MKFLLAFIVLIGGFCLLVWWYILSRLRRLLKIATAQKTQQPSLTQPQTMLECAHCGLHIPEHEALKHANNVYCCAEHIDAAHNVPHQ